MKRLSLQNELVHSVGTYYYSINAQNGKWMATLVELTRTRDGQFSPAPQHTLPPRLQFPTDNQTTVPMSASHPEWGHSLEQCASSYSFEATGRELRWDPERDLGVHDEAMRAINQISMLAGERKCITEGNRDVHVTLHMLTCVHKLYLSPNTLVELASPDLMSGCIKLMESVQCDGKPCVCLVFGLNYLIDADYFLAISV